MGFVKPELGRFFGAAAAAVVLTPPAVERSPSGPIRERLAYAAPSRSPSPRLGRRARRTGLGDRDRHRVGGRALRARAVTGVLQSTLGNLPELFIVLFALAAGEIVVAQTSILGSLFANAAARARPRHRRRLADSRRTRHALPRAAAERHRDAAAAGGLHHRPARPLRPGGRPGERAPGRDLVRSARSVSSPCTPPGSGRTSARRRGAGPRAERARRRSARRVGPLAVAGVAAAFVSDWFVDALDPAVEALGISKAFTGLVIVAIAGNAVENVVGITLAAKGQSDLAISIVKNSVAQIAVLPLPRARPALALLRPPADLRAEPGLRRRARDHGARGVADHRRRRGGSVRGLALVALYVILAVVRSTSALGDLVLAELPPLPGREPVHARGPRRRCGAGGGRGGRPPRTSAAPGDFGPRAGRARSGPRRAAARAQATSGRPRARRPRRAGAARRRSARPRLDLVHLLDAVARVREPVRERAVVREQERAGRVDVEPPDRNHARVVLDELDDGRPPLRVARGRDDAAGLCRSTYASRCFATGSPSTSTTSRAGRRTCSARRARRSRCTRPALISSSALRRDATPARAR